MYTVSTIAVSFGNTLQDLNARFQVACMSTLVRNMVDDSGTDEEIPLPNVPTSGR